MLIKLRYALLTASTCQIMPAGILDQISMIVCILKQNKVIYGYVFCFQPFIQTLPRLLDAASVENVNAKVVSCGARHSAIVTGTSLFTWYYSMCFLIHKTQSLIYWDEKVQISEL